MLNQRLRAAQIVAPELFATEAGIDGALQQSLKFVDTLLSARTTAKLSATVGADAIDEAGFVVTTLLEARRRQIACHHMLAKVSDQIGLRPSQVGNGGEKPDQDVPVFGLKAA